jgi:hypothetical protein
MVNEKKLSVLSQILSNEQQILQRSDQKAYTLLSVLGVYSVFFIVHYTNIPATKFTMVVIFLFFLAVIVTIFCLALVVTPRIKSKLAGSADIKSINPIFFAGISKFETPEEYSKEITLLLSDPDATIEVFAQSVHSIGKINAYKNKFLKYGIIALVAAVSLEFIVIISLFLNLAAKSNGN